MSDSQTIDLFDDTQIISNSSGNYTEVVENSHSKGLIQDYFNVEGISNNKFGILGRNARFDPRKVLLAVRQDPVVKGAIITLVDKLMEGGWKLKSGDKTKQDLLKKLRFNQALKKIAFNCFLYNNAFLEIVGTKPDITDLNLLEITQIKIDAEDNGDLNGYFTYVGQRGSQKRPYWKPEKVTHFKIDDFTTNLWSELNIESIYETILIKDYIRQWLQWFFGTNQLRPVINIKGASNVKVSEFVSFLKSSEAQLKKPLIFEGEVDITRLQSFADEGKSVLDVLNWCDEQIMVLLQVPPVALGKADQSGRSNSVELNSALRTRILSVQDAMEDTITEDLLPKMGIEDDEFQFGQGDLSTRGQLFDDVLKMKQAGFTEEAIIEYLEMNGLRFETEEVLLDPIEQAKEMMKATGGPQGFGNNPNKSASGNSTTAPSRKSQTNTSVSKANSKQMVKNSNPWDTDLIPREEWTYDAIQ